jgi:large subunit ribosomal protein L21
LIKIRLKDYSLSFLKRGQVAQSVEQRTENPCVAGSIPVLAINVEKAYPILEFMNPYAIIQTGGKQYRVETGDVIDVELLEGSGVLTFDQVFFVFDGAKSHVGVPVVPGFVVKGELLGETKGEKVISFKYKKRKNYHRKVGHRQRYSRVKITEIAG